MDIITKFDRIEDILGSSDGRYFGNGYTQVKYFQKVKHITLEILSEIIDGNIHYGSLLRSVEGINLRILAQRLHDFEQEGVLSRKVLPTSPPQVEYKMTKKGIALRSIVEEMKKWEQTYRN